MLNTALQFAGMSTVGASGAAAENAAPQLKQCDVSSKRVATEEDVVSAAAALLHKHCQAHGVDDSHGLKHAREVLAHARYN